MKLALPFLPLLAACAAAPDSLASGDLARPCPFTRLVRILSEPDIANRDAAQAELTRYWPNSANAALAGLMDPDPEVAGRCFAVIRDAGAFRRAEEFCRQANQSIEMADFDRARALCEAGLQEMDHAGLRRVRQQLDGVVREECFRARGIPFIEPTPRFN